MTRLAELLGKPFDALYAVTPNETMKRDVYGGTRPKNGHFSVQSTQSGVSTYRAYEAENDGEMPGSVLPRDLGAYDCADPRVCPDCQPTTSDD